MKKQTRKSWERMCDIRVLLRATRAIEVERGRVRERVTNRTARTTTRSYFCTFCARETRCGWIKDHDDFFFGGTATNVARVIVLRMS